jgi:tRNA A37 threonylcarbamoyladenosine dehydratase
MTHLDEAADLQRRFGGLERLYGVDGAERIRNSHVAVVGIGGVGSWAAEALARSGVGALTLVDLDHVAESNINRQIHALDSTLGQAKVLAMRDRIAQIHPGCAVRPVEEFVEPDNWPGLLPQGVDAVIDACDELKAKTAMAAWAREQRALFIACGAAGGKRLAPALSFSSIWQLAMDSTASGARGWSGACEISSRKFAIAPL